MGSFEKGLLLFRKGEYKKAADLLSIASTEQPDNLKVWNALAVALSKSGNNTRALTAIDAAVRLDPDNPVCKKNREKILTQLSNTFEIDESTYIHSKEGTRQVVIDKFLKLHTKPDDLIQVEEDEEYVLDDQWEISQGSEVFSSDESSVAPGSILKEELGFLQSEKKSLRDETSTPDIDDLGVLPGGSPDDGQLGLEDNNKDPDSPGVLENPDADTFSLIEEKEEEKEKKREKEGKEENSPFGRSIPVKPLIFSLAALVILLIAGIFLWNAGFFMESPEYYSPEPMYDQISEPISTPETVIPTSDESLSPVIENTSTIPPEPVEILTPEEILDTKNLPENYDDAEFFSVTSTMLSRADNELKVLRSALQDHRYALVSDEVETVLNLIYDYPIKYTSYSLSPEATESARTIHEITGLIEKVVDYSEKAIEASDLGEKEVENAHLVSATENIKKAMEKIGEYQKANGAK